MYQDYVCSCALRVAREVLALLPVDMLIVTVNVTALQSSTGKEAETPVLSVAMPRQILERLDFARLDPSDSMENFKHRGDAMASRKSGEFTAIVPLKPSDAAQDKSAKLSLADVLKRVREMRDELSVKLKKSEPETQTTAETNLPASS